MVFRYDLSPVSVKFKERKESVFRFLVQVCAIIGGVFTLAGMVDAVLYRGIRAVARKAQLGKLG